MKSALRKKKKKNQLSEAKSKKLGTHQPKYSAFPLP